MRSGFWILALAAAGAANTSGESAFARNVLAAHNSVREAVHLPPLKWSEKLAAVAQQWATNKIVRSQFQHSHLGHGENLFEIRGGRATSWQVVNAWASEARDYDLQKNTCRRAKCGHYTQIVWRNTAAVGCASAHSSFREVWVCEYDPPGNVVGQRPY
jgi:pathogenesis-related protein 1